MRGLLYVIGALLSFEAILCSGPQGISQASAAGDTVTGPQLLSPNADSMLRWPIDQQGWVFSWKASTDQTEVKAYELWIGSREGQTPLYNTLVDGTSKTCLNLSKAPEAGTDTLMWKVRAYLGMGRSGPWSEERRVTLAGVPKAKALQKMDVQPLSPDKGEPSPSFNANSPRRENFTDSSGNRVEAESFITPQGNYLRRERSLDRKGNCLYSETTLMPSGDFRRREEHSNRYGKVISGSDTTGSQTGGYSTIKWKMEGGKRVPYQRVQVTTSGDRPRDPIAAMLEQAKKDAALPCGHPRGETISFSGSVVAKCVRGDAFRKAGNYWIVHK